MKNKKDAAHRASLFEQLTEPSLNGIRSTPRQKRRSKSDIGSTEIPQSLYASIFEEAKQQRQEVQDADIHLPPGHALLSSAIKAVLSDTESDEDDKDMEVDEETDNLAKADTDQFFTPAPGQPTFGEIVFEKLENLKKTTKTKGSSLSDRILKLYEGVGDLMSRYTCGKIPRALRFVPSASNWEELIYLTRPDQWTPHAYLAATKLFVNSNPRMAQRFINRILLPHLRQEIHTRQKLHLSLYEALKHTCHIPGAFYKGIIIPLCKSGTCTVREAVIFASVMKRVSLPVQHSAAALLCLAEMEYSGPTSFFIQSLLSKKYRLPFKALDGMVEHFMRFETEEQQLPAIWHQSLLMFIQTYKANLKQEDLKDLRRLLKTHHHHSITPVMYKEIDSMLVIYVRTTDKQLM